VTYGHDALLSRLLLRERLLCGTQLRPLCLDHLLQFTQLRLIAERHLRDAHVAVQDFVP
jgi:hypothetical protein